VSFTSALSPQQSEWFSALVDGTIDDDNFAQLDRALSEDRETVRAYVAYMDLHDSLPRFLTPCPPAADDLRMLLDEAQQVVRPVTLPNRARFARLANSPTIAISLVAILFYGAFTLLAWNLRSSQVEFGNGQRPIVAQLIGQSDANWSSGEPGGHGNRPISRGEAMHIESGTVDLQLESGTTLSIAGPANWSIDGINRATLTRGGLVAIVPRPATGFTLETPTARIVDLGTEFGVRIADRGEAQVHVLKGEVDVQPAQHKIVGAGNILRAGQSALITAAGTVIERSSSEAIPFQRLAKRHKKRVAHSQPGRATSATSMIDLSHAVATQSSRYRAVSYAAGSAIDGKATTISHTDGADPTPWWQVDLGGPKQIHAVVLLNRLDLAQSRLRDITIKLLASDGTTVVAESPLLNAGNERWGGIENRDGGPSQLAFDLPQSAGGAVSCRFVRIERRRDGHDENPSQPGVQNYLCLGEVQLFTSVEQAIPQQK
jgi:ferric-dicitrate binding protein FerR (iron transport regulator)